MPPVRPCACLHARLACAPVCPSLAPALFRPRPFLRRRVVIPLPLPGSCPRPPSAPPPKLRLRLRSPPPPPLADPRTPPPPPPPPPAQGEALHILVTRHPYEWLQSMRRNGFYAAFHKNLDMTTFLTLEWMSLDISPDHQTASVAASPHPPNFSPPVPPAQRPSPSPRSRRARVCASACARACVRSVLVSIFRCFEGPAPKGCSAGRPDVALAPLWRRCDAAVAPRWGACRPRGGLLRGRRLFQVLLVSVSFHGPVGAALRGVSASWRPPQAGPAAAEAGRGRSAG